MLLRQLRRRERGRAGAAGGERPQRPPSEVLDLRPLQGAPDRRPSPAVSGASPARAGSGRRHPVSTRCDPAPRPRRHQAPPAAEADRGSRERPASRSTSASGGREEAGERPHEGWTCRPRFGPTRQASPGCSARSTPRSTLRRPRSTASPRASRTALTPVPPGHAARAGSRARPRTAVTEPAAASAYCPKERAARSATTTSTARRGRTPAAGGAPAPDERTQRVRRDEADEGTAPATAVTGPATRAHKPKTRILMPCTGRLSAAASSSPRERTSSGGEEEEGGRSREHERGGESVLVAAAFQPAGEPEEHGCGHGTPPRPRAGLTCRRQPGRSPRGVRRRPREWAFQPSVAIA